MNTNDVILSPRGKPFGERADFMSSKFPKGSLVKFFGTVGIVWCALPMEDKRNTVRMWSGTPRPLDIGLVTSDPYERNDEIYVTIDSSSGSFTLSWKKASTIIEINEWLSPVRHSY